jgi:hypothetical protein
LHFELLVLSLCLGVVLRQCNHRIWRKSSVLERTLHLPLVHCRLDSSCSFLHFHSSHMTRTRVNESWIINYGCSIIHFRSSLLVRWRARPERVKARLCLVREKKIFGCYIWYFMRCQKGFSNTNKKTNYIAHLETAIWIY